MGLRKIKINVLILNPIIWGFFIFNTYGQKIGKPSVSLNNYIYVEIPKLRMIDVLEKIEIEDLNKKKTFTVRCHENDYSIDTEENERCIFKKKTIQLKELKERGEKLKFNIKVFSKSGKQLYIKQFNPSIERLEKVIKIKFI
jgi:hypothetical protein